MTKQDHHKAEADPILDLLDTGVAIVGRGRMLSAFNRRFQGMWRAPESLLLARDERGIINFLSQHVRDGRSFRERIEEIYAAPATHSFDLLHLTDGRVIERYSEPHCVGENAGRVWSYHDLTRALACERPAEKSGRMDSVSRLAAAIAHDFTNVFNAIQGQANLLLANPALDPQETASVTTIARTAQQAVDLTAQLQTFCRRQPHSTEARDVNEVVLALVSKIQGVLPSNVELIFEPEAELPPVPCAVHLIEQALRNLVWNAVEAMLPDGGQLRLSTRLAEIDESHALTHEHARPGLFVSVAVSDTGCGMDAATAERIFEPFFSTKHEAERPGLGLSRADGIVKLHRGWIEVSSQAGYGSTFTMLLPAAGEEGGSTVGMLRTKVPIDLRA